MSVFATVLLLLVVIATSVGGWEKCAKVCAQEIESCLTDTTCMAIYHRCVVHPQGAIACLGRANSFHVNRILKCATTKCDL